MATETVVAREKILAAWRLASVATAAGVTLATWADADQSIGHVFSVSSPGAVNRGRLPVVELLFSSKANGYLVDEGGMSEMAFNARVIVGGVYNTASEELAEDIMQAGILEMRNAADSYYRIMDGITTEPTKGPMFNVLQAGLTAELTWEREA